MSGIVWLASYPKSGNTWLRVFLANYQRDDGQPADINELDAIASDRQLFDELTGIEASDLTAEEIDTLRPGVYRQLASESAETIFLKIHDAYTLTPAGEPLVPTQATRGVVYVLRNPLDVAVSSTHHFNKPVDDVIIEMAQESYELASGSRKLHSQLRQRLLSWSSHVLSWVDQTAIPVHVVRYEDMHRQPAETFSAAVCFAGLRSDPDRLGRALQESAFTTLQEQEKSRGFKERPPDAKMFFRSGRVGSWRDVLSREQVSRLLCDHGSVMRRFGYLNSEGGLV